MPDPTRPLCLRPWFDPRSPHDRKLLLRDDLAHAPVEVDTVEGLRAVQSASFAPRHATVVHQQWGKEVPGGRQLYWLDHASAELIAQAIAGGPTRELLLIFTMPQPGALARFAETLARARPDGQLELLGLLWYFSGDDLTDDPSVATEIAAAAQRLGLVRLSILTGAFDARCDELLAAGVRGNLRGVRGVDRTTPEPRSDPGEPTSHERVQARGGGGVRSTPCNCYARSAAGRNANPICVHSDLAGWGSQSLARVSSRRSARWNCRLERLGVFLKDDANTWPPIETPQVTAALGRRA